MRVKDALIAVGFVVGVYPAVHTRTRILMIKIPNIGRRLRRAARQMHRRPPQTALLRSGEDERGIHVVRI
jgi:hypothetical protein